MTCCDKPMIAMQSYPCGWANDGTGIVAVMITLWHCTNCGARGTS